MQILLTEFNFDILLFEYIISIKHFIQYKRI